MVKKTLFKAFLLLAGFFVGFVALVVLQFRGADALVAAVEPLALESFSPPARVARKGKSHADAKVALNFKKEKKSKKEKKAPPVVVEKVEPFKPTDVATLDTAIAQKYSENLAAYKSAVVTSFSNFDFATADTSGALEAGERQVVAFIAQSAADGKLSQALAAVNSTYKSSPRRTYRTTAYFNHLVATSATLVKAMKLFDDEITVAQNPAKLLSDEEFLSYLSIKQNDSATQKLLQKASDEPQQNASEADLAAVMGAWAVLSKKSESLSAILAPGASDAAREFIKRFSIKDGVLVGFSEDLGANKVLIGSRVALYGDAAFDPDMKSFGEYIANLGFSQLDKSDGETLAALYPTVVRDNTYYPHFELLGEDNGAPVWAYTVANAIDYQTHRMADGKLTVTLSMDFPQTLSHHTIFGGLKPFSTIYIYDISFRSDPRFETYNSSGYVYKMDTSLLLLKSRHRQKTERVRLIY